MVPQISSLAPKYGAVGYRFVNSRRRVGYLCATANDSLWPVVYCVRYVVPRDCDVAKCLLRADVLREERAKYGALWIGSTRSKICNTSGLRTDWWRLLHKENCVRFNKLRFEKSGTLQSVFETQTERLHWNQVNKLLKNKFFVTSSGSPIRMVWFSSWPS